MEGSSKTKTKKRKMVMDGSKKQKKQRRKKSLDCGDLSRDAMEAILARVPAKHITRFKTVCKSWRSLFSTPSFQRSHFVNSQLNNNNNNNAIILTTFSNSNPHTKVTRPLAFFHRSTFLLRNLPPDHFLPDHSILSIHHTDQDHPTLQNLCFRVPALRRHLPDAADLTIRGSCPGHGLLLVSQTKKASSIPIPASETVHHRLLVYNPVNTSCQYLPYRNDDYLSRTYDWTLFYDPTDGDGKYKVCGFHYHAFTRCNLNLVTVGDTRWRMIPYPYQWKPLSQLVFLDRHLHWLTFDSRGPDELMAQEAPGYHHNPQLFIISMDSMEFNFTKTPLPMMQTKQRHLLSEVNGSLCLASFSCTKLLISVQQHGPGGPTWTKRHQTYLSALSNLPASLKSFFSVEVCVALMRNTDCCSDLSELVKIFVHEEDQLICYDLKRQEAKVIGSLSKDQCLRRSYHFYSPTFVRV